MLTNLFSKINRFYLIVVVVFLLLFPLWANCKAIDPISGNRMLYWVCFLLGLLLSRGILRKNTTFFVEKIEKLSERSRFLFFTTIFVVAITTALGMFYLNKDSVNGRLFIWQVSAQMVREKPLFGSGIDAFQQKYMLHQAAFFQSRPLHPAMELADNVIYVYNEPYKVLIELGIIGIFLVICIGICVLFPSGEKNVLCKMAQAALLSLFVFGLFSYPSAILLLRVCMVLFVSMVACYSLPVKTLNMRHSILYSGVLLLGFLLCVPFAMDKINTCHRAFQEWKQGVIFYYKAEYVQTINCFDAAFPTLQTDFIFLVQYGKALSLSGNDERAIDVLNQASKYSNNSILYITLGDCYKNLHQYQKSEDAYLMAYYMVPNRFYPLYLLAKLYHETGQSTKFEDIACKVLYKQPKVPSKAIDEMKTEIRQLKERN